jgi:nucleoid-associated protein YgaU
MPKFIGDLLRCSTSENLMGSGLTKVEVTCLDRCSLTKDTLSKHGFACSLSHCNVLLVIRHVIKNDDTASYKSLRFYGLTKKWAQ